jgi:FkbH-like protein
MTTRRYMEADIKKLSSSRNFLVICAKVEDKFGDHGIVGAAIVEKSIGEWRIDTFLLSCRVIGRKIEEAMLAFILEEARKGKARKLLGEFISTKKNTPARSFYNNSGFELEGSDGMKEVWSYGLEKGFIFPQFIKIIVND